MVDLDLDAYVRVEPWTFTPMLLPQSRWTRRETWLYECDYCGALVGPSQLSVQRHRHHHMEGK